MVSVIFPDIIFRFAVGCISDIYRYHFLRLYAAWCRLYAAAVISLQFIVAIFIIILYYYIYIYILYYIHIIYTYIYIYIYILYRKVSAFTLLNIVQIELQHPVRIQ